MSDGQTNVDVDTTTITLELSEALSEASLVTRFVDEYGGTTEGRYGELQTNVLVIYASAQLREFETGYSIQVASYEDLAGNAGAPVEITFQAELFDDADTCHIVNAQFETRLDATASTQQAYLTASNTSGSYWRPDPNSGGYVLRNGYAGDDVYLAGTEVDAVAEMLGGIYTDQEWSFREVSTRDSFDGVTESAGTYNITNAHLGTD